ncbi:MAG TPA: hypothetical protein VFZ65_19165 [Planctomycetota bacterium]|nr:hypothetical protein [Planctomycetota bacterium]
MHVLLRSLPILCTTIGLAAQDASLPTRRPSFVDRPFEGLFVDTPREDGTIWARGATYKVGFAATGVEYRPFFGPHNPTMPLHLRLGGLTVGGEPVVLRADAQPRAADARITFDRGPLVERWDLQPRTAQQSFVFATSPGSGDLGLDLDVTTAMRVVGRDAEGVGFAAPGLGTVHYSDAVLVEANGRRTSLPVQATTGGLHIGVPASLLAHAAFPVVVDPVLSSRSFDTSANDSTDPELCYDVTNDVWLLVNKDQVGSGDTDIRCRRYRTDGTLLSDTFAENSSDDATSPRVANSKRHARFLVCWIQDVSVISIRVIAREHSTTSAGQGSATLIDNVVQGIGSLDVGGSTDTNGLFLIAWSPVQALVLATAETKCRTYAVGGTLGSVNTLATLTGCGSGISVSRTAGPGQNWAVVWPEDSAVACLGGDVFFAIVSSLGAVAQGRTALDTTNLNFDSFPDVAGDGTHFLAVWHRGTAAPREIMGALIGPAGAGFAKLTSTLDLTQLEPGASPSNDQTSPCVEWDGCRFAYGYSEGTTPRPFLATLAFDAITPVFYEGHVACSTAASTVAHSSIAIASQGASGGEPGICEAVWQQIGNGGRDLEGVLFDLRAATGGVTRVLTHCPGAAAPAFTTIDPVGTPALGRTFSIALGNVAALPFVLAGLELPTPFTLCPTTPGLCRLGVQFPAIVAQFGPGLSVSVPCDIDLVGSAFAFQGVDLGAAGGCGSALLGLPFRVTDTLVVRIQ